MEAASYSAATAGGGVRPARSAGIIGEQQTSALEQMPRSYLVAKDGTVLTQPELRDAGAVAPRRIVTEILRHAAVAGQGAAIYRDFRNVEVVGGFASVSPWDWIVLVEQDASESLAWLRTLAGRAVVVALLVACCVVWMSWRTAGRMSQPLQQLASVAARVARGDHHARVPRSRQPACLVREADRALALARLFRDDVHRKRVASRAFAERRF